MQELREYNINFVGLKEGKHQFDYKIDNKFFEFYDFDEYNKTDILVEIELIKKSTLIELNFFAKGFINIPCDVTNEPFDQEINGEFSLIVKFGPEFNDDNEEVLILPHEEYKINVAQYIYELVVLSVPTKRVHPKVIDGTIDSNILNKLEELEYKENNTTVNDELTETDPRWDKLKDLLTGK